MDQERGVQDLESYFRDEELPQGKRRRCIIEREEEKWEEAGIDRNNRQKQPKGQIHTEKRERERISLIRVRERPRYSVCEVITVEIVIGSDTMN
tara:strand:+ start:113 stop:394 length:282 start_codon:yes stop_codon:yes gene_type:complete